MIPAGLHLPKGGSRKPNAIITSLGSEPHEDVPRISTGLPNLDEMFGGGLALGNVVQLGGDPGIGKSTMLAQLAAHFGKDCIYVTSEESKRRLARRMVRVAGEEAANAVDSISTIDHDLMLEDVLDLLKKHPAKIGFFDSLQALRMRDEDGKKNVAKKQTQHVVRDIAVKIIKFCNERRMTAIMTCHITKDGALAGLKEIQHLVDVVMWFRGSPEEPPRRVSCSKNRDGDTSIAAHFTMTPKGLVPKEAPKKRTMYTGPIPFDRDDDDRPF